MKDYTNKYLKYKSKYLELKNMQIGGNPNKKIFFITDLEGDFRPFISSLLVMLESINDENKILDNSDFPFKITCGNKLLNTKSEYKNELEKFMDELMNEMIIMSEYKNNNKTNFDKIKNTNLLSNYIFELNANWHFVFGGDVGDHGLYTLRIREFLINLKKNNRDNVTLIIGNRDVNKIRFHRELYVIKSRLEPIEKFNKIIESKEINKNYKEIYNSSYEYSNIYIRYKELEQFLKKYTDIHLIDFITKAPWLPPLDRKNYIYKDTNTKFYVHLLKYFLHHEMGSADDFMYRRVEIQQIINNNYNYNYTKYEYNNKKYFDNVDLFLDHITWLSFIIESLPYIENKEYILNNVLCELDNDILTDLIMIKKYCYISFKYLYYGEYIQKISNTIVTHSNIFDNSDKDEVTGGAKKRNGEEISITSNLKTGLTENNLQDSIKFVNTILNYELRNYNQSYIKYGKNNFYDCIKIKDEENCIFKDDDYISWLKKRSGGLLLASACPVSFIYPIEFNNHSNEQIDIYKKIYKLSYISNTYFNWGYCRYREPTTLKPKEYTDSNEQNNAIFNKVKLQLQTEGIKFILTGHTPQPVPIVAIQNKYEDGNVFHYLAADTTYGCFSNQNTLDRRKYSGSCLVVEGDKCKVYGNLGKELNKQTKLFENTDDKSKLVIVKYDIDTCNSANIGTYNDLYNKSVKEIKPYNSYEKCLKVGIYREKDICMVRNGTFNMHSFVNIE